MTQVNVHQAKTHLSRLIQAAERGEDVVIARNGRPAVRLVPVAPARPRRPGRMSIVIGPDFDAPLPDDLATALGAPQPGSAR